MTQSAAPSRYFAKRDEIIAVATDALNEDGVSGFTLAGVGKRLDMHPASLAYYFKKKEELAATCLTNAIGRLDVLVADAEGAATPQERLMRFVEGMFALRRRILLKEEPALASFNEIRMIEAPFVQQVMDAYWKLFHRVENLFAGMDPGARTMRARLVLEQLMWSRVWLESYDERDYARAAARLSDVMIGGIAAGQTHFAPPRLSGPQAIAEDMGASREAFLIAATELINERGYRGASVDKICARLNVTKGSFYHHNADKNDLVIACFERTFGVIEEAQHKSAQAGGDGWQRLSRTVNSLIADHASGRKRLLRSYALSALPAPARQTMILALQKCAHRFASVISDGIADGSIRAIDPLIAAQVVMAAINAAAYSEIWAPAAKGSDILGAYARPALTGLFRRD